jgi:hypothetical protein
MVKDAFTQGRPDKNIPLDPTTLDPVSRGVADKAARLLQDLAVNPEVAARNIADNAAANTAASMPQPTIGLVSGDVGLQSAESAARTKNGVPFIENDSRLREAATERVNSLRDPGADQSQPAAVARTEAAMRTRAAEDSARAEVRQAESEGAAAIGQARAATQTADEAARAVDTQNQQFAAPIAAGANTDAKAQASRRLDNAVVDQGYIPARTQKNEMFDTAPGRAQQVSADPVLAAVDDVIARNNALRPDAQLPQDLVNRLEALRPDNGGTGTALGGDLADTRKFLSSAYERAQAAGNFDMADSIATLRRAVNAAIEEAPGYSEANANFRGFADRFRPSPNDPGAKFTREIDRDPARGATPPSETAGRFLSGPEKVGALRRMTEGLPSQEAADNAIRDYLRSDFGMSALNPNGTLNPNRAAAWARNNADVLDQFPNVRREFDDMTATARRGEQLSSEAQANIKTARAGEAAAEQGAARGVREAERTGQQRVKTTEQEIERSAAGTLLREDPRDTAQRIFGSKKYGAEKELDEVNKLLGADAEAKRGWKAAVSEHLADSVSGTAKLDAGKAGASETYRTELAKLDKMFKENRELLAKVYSPEEMSRLQQAHAVLEPLKNASVRATAGSNTADKGAQVWRLAEGGLKARFGALKGGSYLRTLRIMASTLPSDVGDIQRLIERAWFDPDLAEYLLTKKIRNLDIPASNAHVRRIMGAAAFGRSSGSED